MDKTTQALDIANEAKRIARANIAGELVVIVLCDLIDRLALPPPAVAEVNVQASERRRCKKCHAPRCGETCHKCGEPTFVPHESWIEPELPPVNRIRELAREVGYAIGVHGTLERDLDLIAAPWTDEAVGNHALMEHIAKGLGARIVDIERKPLGRYAATIQMDGYFKAIDISVCPTINEPEIAQASEREKFEQHWACCGFVPDGANPDHIYAAMQSGWMGHAALSPAAVRVEEVKRMKIPADDGPIKGEAIAQRMKKICGCKGQYDCNCVSVKNMALRELWGEHNAATRSPASQKTNGGKE